MRSWVVRVRKHGNDEAFEARHETYVHSRADDEDVDDVDDVSIKLYFKAVET